MTETWKTLNSTLGAWHICKTYLVSSIYTSFLGFLSFKVDLVLKQAKPQCNKFETGSLIGIHSPLLFLFAFGGVTREDRPRRFRRTGWEWHELETSSLKHFLLLFSFFFFLSGAWQEHAHRLELVYLRQLMVTGDPGAHTAHAQGRVVEG